MSTENELNELLAAVREWSFQDLMAAEAMLTAESKSAEADDVAYAIGRKAQADEAWLALISRLRALLTELEAAREDAARYRWLRDECTAGDWCKVSGPYSQMLMIGAQLDKAIDAARKGGA